MATLSEGIQVFKDFSKHAARLRKFYDGVYESQHDPKRFSWDLWNVPNQYHLLRSPATHFFPKSLIAPFMEDLVLWGRENLGCHTISPLWLSAYVDGCEQKLHIDQPHGPWAFVYSLSPKRLAFKGGNTLLLKNEILDHWSTLSAGHNIEMNQIFHSVKPNFNQLLVFDGRIPHGVERVSQVEEMKEARLVLHGWFLPPRPYLKGIHAPAMLAAFNRLFLEALQEERLFSDQVRGFVVYRFFVNRSGRVSKVSLVSSTLRAPTEGQLQLRDDLRRSLQLLEQLPFATARGQGTGTWVTLPIEVG